MPGPLGQAPSPARYPAHGWRRRPFRSAPRRLAGRRVRYPRAPGNAAPERRLRWHPTHPRTRSAGRVIAHHAEAVPVVVAVRQLGRRRWRRGVRRRRKQRARHCERGQCRDGEAAFMRGTLATRHGRANRCDDAHGDTLLVFGLGYCGRAIALEAVDSGYTVIATSRDPARAAPPGGVSCIDFAAAENAIAAATHILTSAAPGEAGDPVLARYAAAVAASPRLRWVGYLSTTASTATMAADGSTRTRLRRRPRRAPSAAWRPRRRGPQRRGAARSICSASRGFTGQAARRSTICERAGRGVSTSRATNSAASTAPTSPPPCSRRWARSGRPAARPEPRRRCTGRDRTGDRGSSVAAGGASPAFGTVRGGLGDNESDGTQLLGGESQGGESEDPGRTRDHLALSELPGRATRCPGRGVRPASVVAAPGRMAVTGGDPRP